VDFIKVFHEVLNMTNQLSKRRFNTLIRLFWGSVIAAWIFSVASLITAIRWW